VVVTCVVRRTWCVGEPFVEKFGPILHDELSIWSFSKLMAGATVVTSIDYDDRPIIGFAARLRLRELSRVERAVATAADDDDISQRIDLPPSITSTEPVA
jgi:hypothetical protein